MRSFALALLLGSAGVAFAQTSTPFAAPPSLNQLFPAPSLQPPGKPQFKLKLPDRRHNWLLLPAPKVHTPPRPSLSSGIDSGILRKPQGFAHQPSRPAPHTDIYPNLTIQPAEIALLTPPSDPGSKLKAEPIPLTFPKGRLEPIPITWDTFQLLPITGSDPSQP
ncbi:MAG TPA: hypothetical protein VGL22_08825 [Terracidiphilus sp.]|jgi:hypothetical protein